MPPKITQKKSSKSQASPKSGNTRRSSAANETNLNGRAYESIRTEILTCALPPGGLFSEADLALRFDMGKAAIRHALAKLSLERLVISRGRQGHEIAPITIKEVQDTIQLRKIVEPEAAALAIGSVDVEELKSLNEKYKEYNQSNSRAAQLSEVENNIEFHLTIARASGNEKIVALLDSLYSNLKRLTFLTVSVSPDHQLWHHDHSKIIDAIAAKDKRLTTQMTLEHVKESENRAIRSMMNLPAILNANISSIPSK